MKIFLLIVLIGNFLTYAVSYVLVNYLNSSPTLGQLSQSDDRIGYLPELNDIPNRFSFGSHYFGDFLEPYLKTLYRAPYTNLAPGHRASNYPPFAQALFFPFTWFPYRFGLILYLLISFFSVSILISICARSLEKFHRIILTCGLTTSLPLLFSLDRGNLWGITIALIIWAYIWVQQEKFTGAACLIALAASIKVFPVFFLVWIYKRSGTRSAVIGLVVGGLVSSLCLLLFKGSPIDNFREFVMSQKYVHANIQDNFLYQRLNNSFLGLTNNVKESDVDVISIIGNFILESFWLVTTAAIFFSIRLLVKLKSSESIDLLSTLLITILIVLFSPTVFTYSYALFTLPLLIMGLSKQNVVAQNCIACLVGVLFINKTPLSSSTSLITGMNLVNPIIVLLLLFVTNYSVLQELTRSE